MEPQRLVSGDSNGLRTKEEVKSVQVILNEIPEFLRRGGYSRSFLEDIRDNEELDVDAQAIMVPETCFRATTAVSDGDALHHLLSTLRFWLVDVLPDSVIAYALNRDTERSFSAVAEPFMNDMPKLKLLQTVAKLKMFRSNCVIAAMKETSCEEVVEYLFEHDTDDSPFGAMVADTAAEVGSVKYLHYVHERGCLLTIQTCSNAAAKGHLHCLKYAHEHGCPWDASTNIRAAEGGHLDCMKYAHEHGCPFDFPTLNHDYGACTLAAASCGHLNCLQYAHQHGASLYPRGYTDAAIAAASGGHVDCVQYALDNGCPCDSTTILYAAGDGKLNCVKYLHELDCPWDKDVFASAAKVGDLDLVVYLHKEGCPWDKDVFTAAANAGHLNVVMYLHKEEFPWDEGVFAAAAKGDHLDIVKYLRREGCPWNAKACTYAAEKGHLDCLQYLHEQGCPWDEETTLAAAANGCVSCLEYAITQGCPVVHNICYRMFATNHRRFPSCHRVDCLKYLHSLGYNISGAATMAAKNARDTGCVEYIASIRKRGRAVLKQYREEQGWEET